ELVREVPAVTHGVERKCWRSQNVRLSRRPRCRGRDTRRPTPGSADRPGILSQSGLAPEDLTTAPHFSVSSATNFPRSTDEPGQTVVHRSASRAFILLSARTMLISLFSVSTIAVDVFLCNPAPNHWLAS